MVMVRVRVRVRVRVGVGVGAMGLGLGLLGPLVSDWLNFRIEFNETFEKWQGFEFILSWG